MPAAVNRRWPFLAGKERAARIKKSRRLAGIASAYSPPLVSVVGELQKNSRHQAALYAGQHFIPAEPLSCQSDATPGGGGSGRCRPYCSHSVTRYVGYG